MTGLLVSVRDEVEAGLAIQAGVGIVDVKEPLQGSLGAADWRVWQPILNRCQRANIPMSVALGELREEGTKGLLSCIPQGVAFAKCGLAGLGNSTDWSDRWGKLVSDLPSGTSAVLVYYADTKAANSPDFESFIASRAAEQASAILVDTFGKREGGLLNHLSLSMLLQLREQTARRGQRFVLAGSLKAEDLGALSVVQPDWIAVRGAVCSGDRTSAVCPTRVATWVQHARQMCDVEIASRMTCERS